MHDTSVCRQHGGAAPQVREAAERRRQETAADALLGQVWRTDVDPISNPVDALQRLAGQLQHAGDVLGQRLATEDLDGPAALAWNRTLRELRQALVEMARLGIAEKHLQLEQERANVVVAAFLGALDVAGLAPTVRSLAVDRFLERLGDLVPDESRPDDGGPVVRGELA